MCADLRLAGAGASATAHALVSDTSCAIRHAGDTLTVALPEFSLFEVIVIGDRPADQPNPGKVN